MLRRIATKTTTNKPSPIVVGLIVAVIVSVGFIIALAILAPQQLAEAAVTARDVICNGCVGTSDIAPGAVKLNSVMRSDGALTVGPGQSGTSEAHCHSGETLTGGGFTVSSNNAQLVIVESHAGGSVSNTWQAVAFNNGTDTAGVTAWAMCATLSP